MNNMTGLKITITETGIQITKDVDSNQTITINNDQTIDKCIWEDGTTSLTKVLELGVMVVNHINENTR